MIKRLLCAVLLTCAYAYGQQINPNQIHPSTNNGDVITTIGGVSTWAPASGGGCTGGDCVLTGPTANQTVLQPGTTNFMTNVLNQQYWANLFGTGSNGIETVYNDSTKCIAQDPANSTGCSIMIPPLYTIADNPPGWGTTDFGIKVQGLQMPAGAASYDYRNGVLQIASRDPGSAVPQQMAAVAVNVTEDSTHQVRTSFGAAGTPTPFRTQMNVYANGFNFQNYFNGIPQYSYGNYYYGQNHVIENWTSGQTFQNNTISNCHGTGDCVGTNGRITVDGGVNTSEDIGTEMAEWLITEDPLVYTGQITSGAGTTTLVTTSSIGGGTQGQDRLIVDSSQVAFTNTKVTSNGGALNNFPPTVADSTQTFPISTMVSLCYAGSDNGAGGATGCTPGSAPSGYIPGQAGSSSGHAPNASIVTNVDATYTNLPSTFCTSANLQSSSSGSACYMPASGVGCLTSPEEYETVNYTYNSGAQQITLLNLTFPHSNNGLTFSTGGLCGYAWEDVANQYTAGGTTGVVDPVYPIEGTADAHTVYYISQRTNEGYGSPLLGGSSDSGTGNGTGTPPPPGYGQLCFSTTSFGWSLNGLVVTFSMNLPAGTANPYPLYNGLSTTITTANSAYNGTYALTYQGGAVFSYTLPTTPGGATPTAGTIAYCNATYKIEPAARITSVYDTANNKVDGTIYTMPSEAPFANGDTIFIPHYQQMAIAGNHIDVTKFQPNLDLGQQDNNFVWAGLATANDPGLHLDNNSAVDQYLGYGGTHKLPTQSLAVSGPWQRDIDIASAPDQAILEVDGCKTVIGCSSPASNYNIWQSSLLASQNPQPGANGLDVINYDSNFMSSTRALGLHSGRVFITNGGGSGAPASPNSLTTLESGYGVMDQSLTTPTVTTNNLFTSQLTSITVFPLAVCTGTCATTWTYSVVGHALVNPTKAVTVPHTFTVANGAATLSMTNYNLICMPYQAGWDSYDILKTDTTHSIALGISATAPNGASFGQPANYACFEDTGASTSAYVPSAVNTTGGANIVGPLNANGVQNTAVTSAGCAQYDSTGHETSTGTGCGGSGPIATAAGQIPAATGAGTTYQAINISKIPVELSGAIPYTSEAAAEAGPDDTANFQSTVTAALNGVATCQAGMWYHVEGPVNFSSYEGLIGTSNQTYTGGHCNLVTNSATTHVLSAVGTSSAYLGGITLANLSIYRSTAGTGTSAGIYASFTGGMIVTNILSYDSIYDFYRHASPGYGIGYWSYLQAGWLLDESSGTYTGFYDDSADGYPENSINLLHSAAACQNLTGSAVSYGQILTGEAVNDNITDDFYTAGCSYGQVVSWVTGGPANSAQDIHFRHSTIDTYKTQGILIQNIPASERATVTVNDPWISGTSTSTAAVRIIGSSGVTITHGQIKPVAGSAYWASGSDSLILANNQISETLGLVSANPPIEISGTSHFSITGNNVSASSGNYGNIVWLTGSSTYGTLSGNTITGYSSNGYGLGIDAGSNFNSYLGNTIDTTHITSSTAIGDSGTGNGSLPPSIITGVNTSTGSSLKAITTTTSVQGYLAQGPLNYQGWNNATPSDAYSFGFAVPGGTAGANFLFSVYAGSSWIQAYAINSSTGVETFSKPPILPSYIVSALPAAGAAGQIVVVTDATSFTAGTCTGSGSDTVLAISNGTSWVCQ